MNNPWYAIGKKTPPPLLDVIVAYRTPEQQVRLFVAHMRNDNKNCPDKLEQWEIEYAFSRHTFSDQGRILAWCHVPSFDTHTIGSYITVNDMDFYAEVRILGTDIPEKLFPPDMAHPAESYSIELLSLVPVLDDDPELQAIVEERIRAAIERNEV